MLGAYQPTDIIRDQPAIRLSLEMMAPTALKKPEIG
jgi:hypothetical protein